MKTGDDMKKRTFEESYTRIRLLRAEIDAELGSATLAEALYQDRRCDCHGMAAEDVTKKDSLERRDA